MSAYKLTELDTVEVSLVDRGANRKRFALRKQEKDMAKMTMTKAQRAKLEKALSGKTLAQIRKDLSEVPPEGRKAIMAAIGILANAQAQLPEGLLQEIMAAAGIESPADMIDLIAGDASADAADGDMPDPDAEPGMDAGDAAPAEDDGSDNTVEAQADSAATDATGDAKPMDPTKMPPKSLKLDPVAKAEIAKAQKAAADAVAQNAALKKQLEANDEKRVELEKQVKVERDARVLKEFIAKAAKLSHLPVKSDELGAVLKALHEAAPEETAKLEKMLEAFNVKASGIEKLLKELGHTRPGNGGETTAWAQIQKAAEELRKADAKLGEAAAVTKAIELNPTLYDEYLKEQGSPA